MKIKIVLPVHNPNEAFLALQLNSISEQTFRDFTVIVVNAGVSNVELLEQLCSTYVPNYVILNEQGNLLNSYHAYEFALRYLFNQKGPTDYLIALCDQDDIWEPSKLEKLLNKLRLSSACMVHSDASVISDTGQLINKSVFKLERRHTCFDTKSLLLANNVTGMTTLFSFQVLAASLPFPKQRTLNFHHDYWLALIASSIGKIAFINEPLVRYRQHSKNLVGVKPSIRKVITLRSLKESLKSVLKEFYVVAYVATKLNERLLELRVKDHSVGSHSEIALKRYEKGGRVLLFLGDALSYAPRNFLLARKSISRAVGAVLRLLLISRSLSENRASIIQGFDETRLQQILGINRDDLIQSNISHRSLNKVRHVDDFLNKSTTLNCKVKVVCDRQSTVNILIPTVNPSQMYAGSATAIDLGIAMLNMGLHVNFVITDSVIHSVSSTWDFIKKRVPDQRKLAKITLTETLQLKTMEFSKKDLFVATAWWTAHIINDILGLDNFDQSRFIYLIQDFEPNFYPWGTDFALAMNSYSFNCIPVINSKPLHDYFVHNGLFADLNLELVFRPNIDFSHFEKIPRKLSARKKIAIYGRPEIDRNMFPMLLAGLKEFIQTYPEAADFKFISIGMQHEPILLSNNIVLEPCGKIPWEEYPSFLSQIDIGIALMHSPHPSHIPLEMASAGIKTITNSFPFKNLHEISKNIISCELTQNSISEKLKFALLEEQQLDRKMGSSCDYSPIDEEQLGVDLYTAVRRALAEINQEVE